MCVQANFADIYLRGMRDRSMRSGTELAREIQLTDWSTAGEHYRSIQVFHFEISVKKKRRKEIPIDKQNFFFVA